MNFDYNFLDYCRIEFSDLRAPLLPVLESSSSSWKLLLDTKNIGKVINFDTNRAL